jgi:nucleotide-binding universal stress UspA family protein
VTTGVESAVAMTADSEQPETFERILLASEGRPFTDAAINRVIELADRNGASVRVLALARIHGVSFGMPNPGLMPTKKELEERRKSVARAIKRLKKKGIEADGHVLGTRKSTKKILEEARTTKCEAIVMAADPDRPRIISDMLWEQEPQRVRRKSKLPVYLVFDAD